VSSDGATCNASNWANGRLTFVDTNGDGVRQGGEAILRASPALSPGLTLINSVGASPSRILYRPTGALDTNAGASFTLCQSGYFGRLLTISATGRAQVAATAAICP
jgi:Tfp pilus assembly protein FimT